MIVDRKLTKAQIFTDDALFLLNLTPVSTWPFVRFVEKQVGMKAFTGPPEAYDDARHSRLIVGGVDHWKALVYPQIDHNPLMLTILQHPLELVLEMYWCQACGIPPDEFEPSAAYNENPRFDIQDFLHDPEYSHWIDNYQSTQLLKLCEVWSPEVPIKLTDPARRSLIYERLEQMAFFGFVDHYRFSQDLLMYTFDKPFSYTSEDDVAPIKLKISDPMFRWELLKPEIIAEIREHIRFDEQIYHWARQLFLARYRMMAHRLESELRWRAHAFAGIQVVALDPLEQFSQLELSLINVFRRLRARLLPQGSKRESWVMRRYLRARGVKPLEYPLEGGHRPSKEIYQRWLQTNAREIICPESESEACFFSLLLFVTSDDSVDDLSATIRSCITSPWKGFELVVVYPEDHAELQREIEPFRDDDERIKLFPLPAETDSNRNDFGTLIGQLQGRYLFFIRCGDQVHRDLLYCVHDALAARPAGRPVDILYYDEDHIGENGERMDPWFKPGTFSPDMLISVNYLRHAAYNRKLFYSDWAQQIAMPPTSTDEWSIAFHCVEQACGEIVHVPRVLYHRKCSEVRDEGEDSKDTCKVIERHLQRIGLNDVAVTYSNGEGVRAIWKNEDQDKVSIIIPTKNNYRIIKRCVESILKFTEYPHYEIVLVDTGSSDPRVKLLYDGLIKNHPVNVAYLKGDFNYSRANNFGAMKASGNLLLFLNNDTQPLDRGWLSELARWVNRPEIGAVGAKLLYPDGSIQAFGTVIGMLGLAHHVFSGMPEKSDTIYGSTMWYRNTTAITGACMMIRRDVFQKVGGFNPGYEIVFSDVEICLKILEAGYRILCTPHARLTHYEGKSRFRYTPSEDIQFGLDRLGGFIQQGDRYYNNNLSLQSTIPALRSVDEEDTMVLVSRVIHSMQSIREKDS
jgi:GT2 family glycosyltransferase